MKYRWLWIVPLAAGLFAAEPAGSVRLQNATTAFHEIMASPDRSIPRDLLDKSRCVVIVPDLLKGAFIFGGKYGRGFASCRGGSGWTAPAAVRIEGGSFGFQLGGSATDLVMLVMNPRGMQRLLGDKFTIGGEAAAAAGPVGRSTSAQTDVAMHAEILTWSRSRGLFAGISLEGATLRPDSKENRKLYGRDVSKREILEGRVGTTGAGRPFVAMLDRESPRVEASYGQSVEAVRRPGGQRNAQTNGQPTGQSTGQSTGRMVLTEREIHFASGQAAIPAAAEPILSQVARMLRDNPGWRFEIEGFSDNAGDREANAKISRQRAEAVKHWLTARGVDPSRLSARGYGSSRPVASNSTENGRARNRRVEIVRAGTDTSD